AAWAALSIFRRSGRRFAAENASKQQRAFSGEVAAGFAAGDSINPARIFGDFSGPAAASPLPGSKCDAKAAPRFFRVEEPGFSLDGGREEAYRQLCLGTDSSEYLHSGGHHANTSPTRDHDRWAPWRCCRGGPGG